MPAGTGGHLFAPKCPASEAELCCAEPQELSAAHIITEPQICPALCTLQSSNFWKWGQTESLAPAHWGCGSPYLQHGPRYPAWQGRIPGWNHFEFHLTVWAVVVHFHHSVCHPLTQCVSTMHRLTVSKLQPGAEKQSRIKPSSPLTAFIRSGAN